MAIEILIAGSVLIGVAMLLMGIGALIFRAGVSKGLEMSRMAWNLQNDFDPLEPTSKARAVPIEDIPDVTE